MRPLFARSDVVLCASDGVTSRRVANHLARRAGVPIVFAAVFEEGAFGEVIRVRPRTGCLLCLRKSLQERDVLDPEPGVDPADHRSEPFLGFAGASETGAILVFELRLATFPLEPTQDHEVTDGLSVLGVRIVSPQLHRFQHAWTCGSLSES
jgi:molybdopterin/thiamine biosynthesis adenylyltransferase